MHPMHPTVTLPRQVVRLVPLALALIVAGCAGGTTEPAEPVASVDITGVPTEGVLLVGGTVQLTATARDAGGDELDRGASWTSSANTIATVSPSGLVTAVSSGVVFISAEAGGVSESVGLSVRVAVPVPAASAGAPVTTTIPGGGLSLTVAPGAAAVPTLTVGRTLILTNDPRFIGSTSFVIGPAGVTFTGPVTVEVGVNLAALAPAKRAGLRLFRVMPNGDLEGIAASSVDQGRSVVVSPLTSTGTYVALVPGDPASLVAAEGDSRLVEVGTAVPGIGVIARDAAGYPVPGARVEFSIQGGGGSIVGETVAFTDIEGRADLPGAWIAGPAKGAHQLRAAITGLPLAVNFSATAFAPAVAVRIESAPTAGLSGVALGGASPVELVDVDGERTEVNAPVTLSVINAGGTVASTTEQLAVLGGAIFGGPQIDGPGTYRIVVSSPGLEPDTTDAITVTQRVAWLHLLTQPSGAASGLPFTTQPVVELRDDAGIRVAGGTAAVTASAHGTGVLFGTRTVAAVDGVATFTNLAVEGTGSLQINFTSDGPVNVLSGDLVVAPAPVGVRLLVGGAPVFDANPGQTFGVPLTADLSNRGTADLAALDVTLTWDPARFEFMGSSNGPWLDGNGNGATITADESNVAAGSIRFTGSTAAATTATFRLGLVLLRALPTATTVESTMGATVHAASNAAAGAVTLTVLPMTVTVHAP